MPRIAPLPEAEATGPAEKFYGRVRELFGTDSVPDFFLPMGRVPAFLQDFYMNFKKFVYSEGKLDPQTKAAISLAVSTYAGCRPLADWCTSRAEELGFSTEQVAEIIAVASTNTMYNVFFKFRDLSGSDIFSGMSVGLRASTFAGTSLDDRTIELINLALSDVNACRPCVEGHLAKARKLSLSDEQALEAIQCAAVILAGSQFLKSAE